MSISQCIKIDKFSSNFIIIYLFPLIPIGYPPGIIRKKRLKKKQHKVFQKIKCSKKKSDSFSKMPHGFFCFVRVCPYTLDDIYRRF
jgi:hypothetical protein